MNLVAFAPAWVLVLLFAALAAAAIEDFLRLRISNITCLAVFVTALLAMAFHGFSFDLWQNALVFLVLLVAGTFLFSANKMGAGDVKLLASLGLWMDIRAGIWLLALTLLSGGFLALIYIAMRYFRGDRGKSSKGIPYGLAIVAGAGLVLAAQLGFMKSKSDRPPAFTVKPAG